MKIKRALEILELHENEYNEHSIKKQYRLMALKYHPDKTGEDTTHKFQEIQEAYESLIRHKEPITKDYNCIFEDFLNSIDDNGILSSIFKKVEDKCYDNVYQYINKKSLVEIINIKTILFDYKNVLSITEQLIKVFNDVIDSKKENIDCYVLNPSLDDLLLGNIYKLKRGNNELYVPLWYNILEHDNNIITICELEENDYKYRIDEKKNIHIDCDYCIDELLNNTHVTINMTKNYSVTIKTSELYIKSKQLYIIENKGIPYPNRSMIYSDEMRSNIILHITIY
jgi:hypothetical protein